LITEVKSILRLYAEPGAAMSEILDHCSLVLPSAAVLVISWAFGRSIPALSFYAPLLVLALFYVPGILLIHGIAERTGVSFGVAFQRDYTPLLTCVASAWTAANLPLLVVAWFFPALFAAAAGLAYVYLGVLVFFAVRTVFGTSNAAAILTVSLSWIPLVAAYFLWAPLHMLLGFLASPFILLYLFYFLRGSFGNLGAGLRSRQSYRRNLEAAAINPHDGEAQYQLGLIYQQRRQFTEAIRRFQNAVTIDASQTDAHFQLGRIARDQGRRKDALGYFQTVVNQDEKHSQSEILRELGALYLSARQYEDAKTELERFLERRPYDAEGLWYYGQALEGLGKLTEAREAYERAAEAANLAPRYLRQFAMRWGRMARKQAAKLAG
jgi:tetratricopeptide (TPR) repeat protein